MSSPGQRRRLEAAVQAIQGQWGAGLAKRHAPCPGSPPVPSLSTGLAALDHILAIGGLPLGHITELIGQPTSGSVPWRCTSWPIPSSAIPASTSTCPAPSTLPTWPPAGSTWRLVIAAPSGPSQALDLGRDLAASGRFGLVIFDFDRRAAQRGIAARRGQLRPAPPAPGAAEPAQRAALPDHASHGVVDFARQLPRRGSASDRGRALDCRASASAARRRAHRRLQRTPGRAASPLGRARPGDHRSCHLQRRSFRQPIARRRVIAHPVTPHLPVAVERRERPAWPAGRW